MVIFHSYVSLPEGIRNEVAFKITAVLSPVLLGKTPMDCGLADYHIPQIHMTKYPQSKSPKNMNKSNIQPKISKTMNLGAQVLEVLGWYMN